MCMYVQTQANVLMCHCFSFSIRPPSFLTIRISRMPSSRLTRRLPPHKAPISHCVWAMFEIIASRTFTSSAEHYLSQNLQIVINFILGKQLAQPFTVPSYAFFSPKETPSPRRRGCVRLQTTGVPIQQNSSTTRLVYKSWVRQICIWIISPKQFPKIIACCTKWRIIFPWELSEVG